jgi:bisanhydrobacterioruberin hydratase
MLRHYYFRLSSLVIPYSIWIIGVLHLVGIAGMLSPFQEYFRLLTPFNLITCALLLWINHREKGKEIAFFSTLVFILGYLVEFIGVKTGLVFGDYQYGATLGPKLFGVPVIIGLNWLLVMYCVASLTDTLKISVVTKVILASLLAVAIDWLIEPVAMHYDFWNWKNGVVPFQNYVGWFITSVVMQSAYHLFKVKAENRLALTYYFIQLFFFLVLNLAIR